MCSFQGTSSTSVLPHLLGSLKINQKIFKEPGSHLLSHAVSSIVPSAAQVLTIVFGMGTGVSPKRIATSSSYPVFETVKSAASSVFLFLMSLSLLPFLNN